MPIDSAKTLWIECTLQNDPRLIPGLAAVVTHAVRYAGLSEQEQADVSTAVVEACRETFRRLRPKDNSAAAIKIFVADFADRVEVKIESSGETAPGDLDWLRKDAGTRKVGGPRPMEGTLVDRVQYEARDGRSRITLVKFCGASKTHPAV
jgi:anti-sigma regulatory factor (Ser/Thr protein kinase)